MLKHAVSTNIHAQKALANNINPSKLVSTKRKLKALRKKKAEDENAAREASRVQEEQRVKAEVGTQCCGIPGCV